MKKRVRIVAAIALVVILAAAWTWRYVTMNQYYDDLYNGDYQLYQLGETVPFEDDGNDFYTDLNGYSIRADRFEIQDYDAYLQATGITVPYEENKPEKLALVYITLDNQSCQEGGLTLTALQFHGIDSTASMHRNVLIAANTVLQGNTGIALQIGQECQLVLPFSLHEDQYNGLTWRNIEEERFFLQVTSALTTKEIQVNE